MRLVTFAAAAVLATQATTVYATADGPDFWRVWNVAVGDTLNYRVGPGSDYPKLGSVPHDARKLKVTVCVPTTTRDQWFSISEELQQQLIGMPAWCLIEWQDEQLGWVNRRYLTEDDE